MSKVHENDLTLVAIRIYKKVEKELQKSLNKKYGDDLSDHQAQKDEDLKTLKIKIIRYLIASLSSEDVEKERENNPDIPQNNGKATDS